MNNENNKNNNKPLSLAVLYSISDRFSSEKSEGITFECRRIKRDEQDRIYEIRKKYIAIRGILAKTQRLSKDD